MSYHDHDGGSRFHGQGRFAGVERMIPEVHEPVEMPPAFDPLRGVTIRRDQEVKDTTLTPHGYSEIRLGRIFLGACTLLGTAAMHLQYEAGNQDWQRTAVVTAVSALATLATIRIRE